MIQKQMKRIAFSETPTRRPREQSYDIYVYGRKEGLTQLYVKPSMFGDMRRGKIKDTTKSLPEGVYTGVFRDLNRSYPTWACKIVHEGKNYTFHLSLTDLQDRLIEAVGDGKTLTLVCNAVSQRMVYSVSKPDKEHRGRGQRFWVHESRSNKKNLAESNKDIMGMFLAGCCNIQGSHSLDTTYYSPKTRPVDIVCDTHHNAPA